MLNIRCCGTEAQQGEIHHAEDHYRCRARERYGAFRRGSCRPGDPAMRCSRLPRAHYPGDVNQYIRENLGSPGQVAKDPLVGLSANEIAALYNTARKTVCPNPS